MAPQKSDTGIIGLLDALELRVRLGNGAVKSGAELEELHEYIRKAREVLRLLEEQRNNSLPINRLPTEILTSIFEGLQDHTEFEDLFPAATAVELSSSHSWMVVTHICRHWRTIALSNPTLWKNLFTRTIRAAPRYGGWNHEIPNLLMGRSSPASLRLNSIAEVFSGGPDDTDEPEGFYQALENNVERMESFHIASFTSLDINLLNIFNIPLPRLSSLHLRIIDDRNLSRDIETGVITFQAYADEVELPSLFGGGPSDLRRFSLWHYTCWLHNTFPRLTHLSLHEQLETPTLDDFLNTLEASPCLEVLHLERAGPEIPNRTSMLPMRRVALPNLREVRFLIFDPNPMNYQHRILECLTIPPFIEILFSLPRSDKGDLHRLLPGFPYCDSVKDIRFVLSFEENPCSAVKFHDKNQLTLQTNEDAVSSYLPSLGAQFPNVTHILFQNTLGSLPWYYSGQFNNFNNLTTITIGGPFDFHDMPNLIHLLADEESSSDDVPCPKLSRIMVYAVDLNPDAWLGAEIWARQLIENPVKVVERMPDNNFEIHLVSQLNTIPPMDIRWTRRW